MNGDAIVHPDLSGGRRPESKGSRAGGAEPIGLHAASLPLRVIGPKTYQRTKTGTDVRVSPTSGVKPSCPYAVAPQHQVTFGPG